MDSSSDDDDVFNFKKRAVAVARSARGSWVNKNDDDSDSDSSDSSNDSHQNTKRSKLIHNYKKSWDDNDDDGKEVGGDNQDKEVSTKEVVVTLDSDDSDNDDYKMLPSNSSQAIPMPTKIAVPSIDEFCTDKETQNALQKAREARMALLKPVDVDVESSDDEILMNDVKLADVKHQYAYKQHEDEKMQGPVLSLKLRTTISRGASSSQGSTDVFTMHKSETFASLLEKYRNKFKLSPADVVKLSFDGQILNLQLTPGALDMEDDDLVDVSLTQTAAPLKGPSQVQKYPSKVASDTITIVTRVKGGDSRVTHKYVLKMNDPFRKLLNTYRQEHGYSSVKPVSLEYNGKALDPDSTPGTLKMKGEVRIEVIDTEEKLKQLERCGKLLETVSGDQFAKSSSNTISLKLRVTNKGEKNMTEQSYELGLNDSFKILINQFCEKNKVSEKECKFSFDGTNLNLNGTPKDEGLEGEEIIDVLVHRMVKPSLDAVKNNGAASMNFAQPTSNDETSSNGRIIAVNTMRNNVSSSCRSCLLRITKQSYSFVISYL